MTEELKQKARQKALEWNDEKINGKYNRPPIANWSCYEKGYIAGATENGIQWHDLRKDPNDLPKRMGNVVQNQDGDKVTYDYRLKKWRWLDGCDNGLEMIAWCEIQQFNSEE